MKIKNWLIVYALLFLGGLTALAQNNVDFDEYFDENNCQRVYEAIRRLDEPTE